MAGAAEPSRFLFQNLHQSFSHLVSKRGAQKLARLLKIGSLKAGPQLNFIRLVSCF
jgi:hypothetical protein